jgi:hypothetical protein
VTITKSAPSRGFWGSGVEQHFCEIWMQQLTDEETPCLPCVEVLHNAVPTPQVRVVKVRRKVSVEVADSEFEEQWREPTLESNALAALWYALMRRVAPQLVTLTCTSRLASLLPVLPCLTHLAIAPTGPIELAHLPDTTPQLKRLVKESIVKQPHARVVVRSSPPRRGSALPRLETLDMNFVASQWEPGKALVTHMEEVLAQFPTVTQLYIPDVFAVRMPQEYPAIIQAAMHTTDPRIRIALLTARIEPRVPDMPASSILAHVVAERNTKVMEMLLGTVGFDLTELVDTWGTCSTPALVCQLPVGMPLVEHYQFEQELFTRCWDLVVADESRLDKVMRAVLTSRAVPLLEHIQQRLGVPQRVLMKYHADWWGLIARTGVDNFLLIGSRCSSTSSPMM